MNTTAWKVQICADADAVAAFLTQMKNEWDALNSKVVFNPTMANWIVIYPVPFSTTQMQAPA